MAPDAWRLECVLGSRGMNAKGCIMPCRWVHHIIRTQNQCNVTVFKLIIDLIKVF